MAVGALTRQRDEELAAADQARIDGGATDGSVGPGEQPAAGQADQVVGGEGWDRGRPRKGLDGSTSVTDASVA